MHFRPLHDRVVVRRIEGTIDHHRFADLPDLLTPGDLLVLNDTRVIPARLIGRRARTGGKWEGLFLREVGGIFWFIIHTFTETLENVRRGRAPFRAASFFRHRQCELHRFVEDCACRNRNADLRHNLHDFAVSVKP